MIDELRKYLRPGDTAIDIGAQVGDTTVPMAFAVGKEGCVFGLEPNDHTFAVLADIALSLFTADIKKTAQIEQSPSFHAH
jgi:tRNA A58 N-methylase Trm61